MKVLAAVLAALAILAGCGDEGGVETSALGKAAFIGKANAACERLGENSVTEDSAYQRKSEAEGASESVALAEMAEAVMVPAIEAKAEAIRSLGAPAGDEEKIESILAAEEEATAEIKDLSEVDSIQVIIDYMGEPNVKLYEYGLDACAS